MTKVAELTLLKKIQVPTEVATDPLEFLDFKTKFDKECKQIFEGVFAKDTNNFTYVLPSTCFLKITLKASLKVLLWVLEGFGILMENLKSAVKNIKTI